MNLLYAAASIFFLLRTLIQLTLISHEFVVSRRHVGPPHFVIVSRNFLLTCIEGFCTNDRSGRIVLVYIIYIIIGSLFFTDISRNHFPEPVHDLASVILDFLRSTC